jgi:protein-export membrane protein SecD
MSPRVKAWLVAGLLIVACGEAKKTPPLPLVILDYEVAPGDGQTEEQARDLAIQAMRTRLDSLAMTAPIVVPRGPSRIHVELQGEPDELARTIEILERSAALGVHPIVEDDPDMDMIYSAARDDSPAGISVDREEWQGSDGTSHALRYLWAEDPRVLETWLATRHAGGGHRIVLERVDSTNAQAKPRWRSHVIDLAAIVTGKDVAAAKVTYDPNTMRPEVELTLTSDGARRFGDATAALVGHKLAIVLDAKVVSAPVVNSAIPGGRISIAMGAGDQKELERQAFELVETLKSGSMPAVLRMSERHVGPAR